MTPCPGCGDPDWFGWYCDTCDPNADHPPQSFIDQHSELYGGKE